MDLVSLVDAARGLAASLDAAAPGLARLAAGHGGDAARANRLLMRLSRLLVPLLFTRGDRFAHDPAVRIPPLAGPQRGPGLPRPDAPAHPTQVSPAALRRQRQPAH